MAQVLQLRTQGNGTPTLQRVSSVVRFHDFRKPLQSESVIDSEDSDDSVTTICQHSGIVRLRSSCAIF